MPDIDAQIAEFEQAIRELWAITPREYCLLQTEIILAEKNHKARSGLRHRLNMLRARQLAGERAA